MQLKCAVCGNDTKKIDRKVKEGFSEIAYYDIIQIADSLEKPASLDYEKFLVCDTMPSVGENRYLYVIFPFSFDIGEEFNVLYVPALSFWNGWEEFPEEIDQSAVVRFRFDSIFDRNEYCAWINAEVKEVKKLSEFYKIYPETYTDMTLENFDVSKAIIYTLKYENWEYYSWDGQGDVGEWKLIFRDPKGIKHLVLQGEWGFHYNNIYCGNIVYRSVKDEAMG